MTEAQAYDYAVELWGNEAAVWRIPACDGSPSRCVVGKWVSLGHAYDGGRLILKTNHKGLAVLGEGVDWSAAFLDAQQKQRLQGKAR